ncbi:Photosystem II reaction center X protein [Actinidia chinensis var. chinensis]|uniref:Photosystem II reaction center X protein n=1 Tax=Actinidia chinensis var. chinensis TaxID=1590841 RepID=A0A2R6R259_ACTCC|nr:Photosystem II reaction center X protein [Actinidia chinensis var. chinensis]
MASVSMAMSLTHKGLRNQPTSGAFLRQLPLRPSNKPAFVSSRSRAIRVVQVQASLKEKAITGLTAAVLTASMVLPEAAEAASSFSPSLKNFLLSIGAGGVVLTAILGAVIGVANFDPVKRT